MDPCQRDVALGISVAGVENRVDYGCLPEPVEFVSNQVETRMAVRRHHGRDAVER